VGEDRGCLYLMMPADLVERGVEACRWGRGGRRGGGGGRERERARELYLELSITGGPGRPRMDSASPRYGLLPPTHLTE
jgi:hypothetical protein